jgi:Virulence-associated protein E/Primase C terminal 2 (PriCT-2)
MLNMLKANSTSHYITPATATFADPNTRTVWVTRFKDEQANTKSKAERTLPELRDHILATTANSKMGLPWLKLAKFGDVLSDKNCYRTDANMLWCSGVECDYDAEQISFETAVETMRAARIHCLLYTSASHRPLKPRWRILAPTSCHIDPDKRAAFVARINGLFEGALGEESFGKSLSYLYGSVNNNPDHRAVVVDGDYIDLRHDLIKGAIFKSGSGVPPRVRSSDPNGIRWDKVNDYIREEVDIEEVKAALDAISPDCKYREWWPIGAALWNTLGDDGEDLFIEWSKKCPERYNEKDVAEKWKILKTDDNDHGAGKIFGRANDEKPGWRAEWRASQFTRTKTGAVAPTQGNIRLALKLIDVTVRYNLFEDRAIIEGLPGFDSLNDAAMDRLWLTIDVRCKFRATKEFFWTVVFDEARLNSFHPVREYLDGLKWDGTKRIDSWLIDYGQAKDTDYTRAVGALFLVAAIRRVRSPGAKFDEMLVLHSEQGLDKSSALAILAVKPEWFTDDLPLNSDSKKTIERLRGRWIVEAAELKGMRYGDIEHLKAFLSRTVDRARMSYDRANSELKRQCVIAGTTNHEKFLRDQTGNRRFWPVRDIVFDLKKLTQDRDQLWAEAAAREAEGVSIRLPKELWAEAGAEQTEHMIAEPWIEVVHDHLKGRKGKLLCSDAWMLVEISVANRTQIHCERLGVAMKANGWERRKQRFGHANNKKSKVLWAYVPEDTAKGATLPKIVVTVDQWGRVEFVALQKETKF